MPKGEKIGKDVLGKKGKMTAKESEKFEEFKAKREAEKRKKPEEEIEGEKVETKAPEEKQPTDEQLARERAKEMEELAKAKEKGELKPVHVREHRRSLPEEPRAKRVEGEGIEEFELLQKRAEESMEEEEEEELPPLLKPKKKE